MIKIVVYIYREREKIYIMLNNPFKIMIYILKKSLI